jgi:hypothetical protein
MTAPPPVDASTSASPSTSAEAPSSRTWTIFPTASAFPDYLAEKLRACRVELVVIGRFWLTLTTPDGVRRLDVPGDFVRTEIETGLRERLIVVPVLVDNASMPHPESVFGNAIRRPTIVGKGRLEPIPLAHEEPLDEDDDLPSRRAQRPIAIRPATTNSTDDATDIAWSLGRT